MCGACGSAPDRHWSAPFLATLPARSSAARAVTAMAVRAGARITVTAAAGGYAIATATGRRSVAANLGEVWVQLRQLHVLNGAVPPVPATQIPSAGPATVPPSEAVGPHAYPAGRVQLRCAALPSWRHRFPAILAWLAATDGQGPRGLRLLLALTPETDAVVDVVHGFVVRCATEPGTRPAESRIDLDDPSGSFAQPLDVLLGPLTLIDR
jgi:hypothetical protein